jgi:Acetyltransferase (GNAT) domain
VISADTLQLRSVTLDEFDDLFAFSRTSFHSSGPPDDRDAELAIFEADRSIGLFDGDTIVGSAAAYTRDMTLPGAGCSPA